MTSQDHLHPSLNQPVPDVVGMVDDRRTDKTIGIRDMLVERMVHHDDDFVEILASFPELIPMTTSPLTGSQQ